MAGGIEIKIDDAAAQAKLLRLAPQVQTEMRVFVSERLIALRDAVKGNIAAMFRSTGLLYRSVQARMEESPSSFTGVVWIDGGDVPYAEIQERGGKTAAHEILPVRASVLAFMAPGKMGFSGGPKQSEMVFAKRVNHPGSNIPEHPYARLAAARERPVFVNGIREIVQRAVR